MHQRDVFPAELDGPTYERLMAASSDEFKSIPEVSDENQTTSISDDEDDDDDGRLQLED